MKILVGHNRYQQPGGEDEGCSAEINLLREAGNTVIEYLRDNQEIEGYGPLRKGILYFKTTWAWDSYRDIRNLCALHRPDVAHFHNTMPLISPSAYYACKDSGVPVVQTLHNYRLICPSAVLMRDGRVCEECLGGDFGPALRHGCYRGSRLHTGALVRMLKKHRRWHTYERQVDCYIALTEFSKNKFISGGLPKDRIVVKGTFLRDNIEPTFGGHYALFIGRHSQEKGAHVLLEAWSNIDSFPLKLVGDGPLRSKLMAMAGAAVEFPGYVEYPVLMKLLKECRFYIFPSIWYEGLPATIVRAFACGKPVLASRLGSAAEIVSDGKTGLLFEPGNPQDLAMKAQILIADPSYAEELGRNARAEFEARYMPASNYRGIMGIYERILQKAGS